MTRFWVIFLMTAALLATMPVSAQKMASAPSLAAASHCIVVVPNFSAGGIKMTWNTRLYRHKADKAGAIAPV